MSSNTTVFFYLIVEIISLWFVYLAKKARKNIPSRSNNYYSLKNGIYIAISFVTLFLVAALREHVGTDYSTYVDIYSKVIDNNFSPGERTWLKQSPLFYILCIALSKITKDYHLMFGIVSFVTIYFVYRAIIRSSSDCLISLYLYFCFCLYFQSFNQIRQMAAVSISLYAITWLAEKKREKFIFWIFVAAGFHMSALIVLSLLVVWKWKISTKNMAFYAMGGIVLFFGFPWLLDNFSTISYIRIYRDSVFATSFTRTSVLNLMVRIAMYMVSFWMLRPYAKKRMQQTVLLNTVAICTLFQVCAVRFSIFGRITTYFFVAYLLLIPDVFRSAQRKFTAQNPKIGRSFLVILCFLYQLTYYFSSACASGGGYLNYYFITI